VGNRGIFTTTRAATPLLVGLVLVGAACSSSGSTAKAADKPSPATRVTAAPPTTVEKPKPYDPTKPIDLGGESGVTKAEQTRAETLLRATIKDLPQYADPATAEAHGYRSIGDSITGDEHYVNWSYANDGHILDPKRPESVVYERINGKQRAVAAMYGMPFGSTFADVPDVGGALTQWHVHANLCLTDNPEQRVVAGLTSIGGDCPPGTSKAGNTPMLHVWIYPNPCGPFAALEGIGAGQVPEGQTRNCDTKNASVR
jgi:hypothetical protein